MAWLRGLALLQTWTTFIKPQPGPGQTGQQHYPQQYRQYWDWPDGLHLPLTIGWPLADHWLTIGWPEINQFLVVGPDLGTDRGWTIFVLLYIFDFLVSFSLPSTSFHLNVTNLTCWLSIMWLRACKKYKKPNLVAQIVMDCKIRGYTGLGSLGPLLTLQWIKLCSSQPYSPSS